MHAILTVSVSQCTLVPPRKALLLHLLSIAHILLLLLLEWVKRRMRGRERVRRMRGRESKRRRRGRESKRRSI